MFTLHEEFIPILKSNVPVKKKRYWEQIPYVLAPLPVPTTVQHEMKEKVQIEMCGFLAIVFLLANRRPRWRLVTLKGSHSMEGGRNFLKIFVHHPVKK
jgi:hypothetical protein